MIKSKSSNVLKFIMRNKSYNLIIIGCDHKRLRFQRVIFELYSGREQVQLYVKTIEMLLDCQ